MLQGQNSSETEKSKEFYVIPMNSIENYVKTVFTMYTSSLGPIIRCHGLCYHLYADDTQLYIAFKMMMMSEKLVIRALFNCRGFAQKRGLSSS